MHLKFRNFPTASYCDNISDDTTKLNDVVTRYEVTCSFRVGENETHSSFLEARFI